MQHTTPSYAAPPSRASHGMIKHINSDTCTFSLPLSYFTHERRPCHCTPAKKQSKTVLALLFVEALKKTGVHEYPYIMFL